MTYLFPFHAKFFHQFLCFFFFLFLPTIFCSQPNSPIATIAHFVCSLHPYCNILPTQIFLLYQWTELLILLFCPSYFLLSIRNFLQLLFCQKYFSCWDFKIFRHFIFNFAHGLVWIFFLGNLRLWIGFWKMIGKHKWLLKLKRRRVEVEKVLRDTLIVRKLVRLARKAASV